jgi:hypothetical protein
MQPVYRLRPFSGIQGGMRNCHGRCRVSRILLPTLVDINDFEQYQWKQQKPLLADAGITRVC